MSRLSFALTIAALVGATVVLSAFALHSLFAPDPGNEDSAQRTEEMTQATETTEETTAYKEETTAYKEETTGLQGAGGDLDRPPDSTLSHGGQEVRGTLGSYCWGDTCADMAYPVRPPKQTLSVPSGSEMVFRYGGQDSPDRLEISVTPLDKYGKSETASADSKPSRSLKAVGSGVERTIPVELPPREYVVDVYVEKSQPLGLGQADYFFRVKVE
jgi:hypothetical protein